MTTYRIRAEEALKELRTAQYLTECEYGKGKEKGIPVHSYAIALMGIHRAISILETGSLPPIKNPNKRGSR